MHSLLSSENLTVTWKRCKIGGKLVVITNRKSYMSFRLVLKSVTLNGVMAALSLRYFNQFAKPAFQLITGSSSTKLIDQKSASVTHIAVKLVYVTKFTHLRVKWIGFHRYLLVIYRLSFALPL